MSLQSQYFAVILEIVTGVIKEVSIQGHKELDDSNKLCASVASLAHATSNPVICTFPYSTICNGVDILIIF